MKCLLSLWCNSHKSTFFSILTVGNISFLLFSEVDFSTGNTQLWMLPGIPKLIKSNLTDYCYVYQEMEYSTVLVDEKSLA